MILTLIAAALAGEPATCVFDTAPPEPCEVTFQAGAGGATLLRARGRSGKQVTFSGRRNSGWWAGTLDGKSAMGLELNRGNVVFSTRALDRSFQYWTRGNEHGSY
ncbi:hypothetical protein [Sphingomonas xinjiangensis]|uniref:Uncharacterized protein n=1 Tax=Sphingomonas xinjiangensis TaxID=643568 RepID=A0A840YQU9_9SPHN|nr:hypothetical protein [Sphingomonas xinjiangensis]MBB5710893.1 hypothetical protein [Sphingomonas xinjiangensis]